MHIHEYHFEDELKQYWSGITGIPLHQFTKSYLKSHTKRRKRIGYMGTVKIVYHDIEIVRELKALYNAMAQQLRAIG